MCGENPSPQLMVFGLAFSVYFPMRAANSLMRAVRTAYHLGPPRHALVHYFKSLLYTVLLILAIALTLAMMTVGDRLLAYAVENFSLPPVAAEAWAGFGSPWRAPPAFSPCFSSMPLPRTAAQPWRNLWPGTLFSLAAWLTLSFLYSVYVDNFAHYSVLYGSIGTMIVLMIWLYMSSATLIMGAELNGTIISLRKDKGQI